MDSTRLQLVLRKVNCMSYDNFKKALDGERESFIEEMWQRKNANLADFIMNIDEQTLDSILRKLSF